MLITIASWNNFQINMCLIMLCISFTHTSQQMFKGQLIKFPGELRQHYQYYTENHYMQSLVHPALFKKRKNRFAQCDYPKYMCNKCDTSFKYMKGLTFHKKWNCGQVSECLFCRAVFATRQNLLGHMKKSNCRNQMVNDSGTT